MEAISDMNADLMHEHKASKGCQEVTAAEEWSWIPGNVPTEGLLSGLEAASTLQRVTVPLWLDKQLANYVLRANTELTKRGMTPPSKGES
jgi:hypothetical protein